MEYKMENNKSLNVEQNNNFFSIKIEDEGITNGWITICENEESNYIAYKLRKLADMIEKNK